VNGGLFLCKPAFVQASAPMRRDEDGIAVVLGSGLDDFLIRVESDCHDRLARHIGRLGGVFNFAHIQGGEAPHALFVDIVERCRAAFRQLVERVGRSDRQRNYSCAGLLRKPDRVLCRLGRKFGTVGRYQYGLEHGIISCHFPAPR
jgi:hypothetical protein